MNPLVGYWLPSGQCIPTWILMSHPESVGCYLFGKQSVRTTTVLRDLSVARERERIRFLHHWHNKHDFSLFCSERRVLNLHGWQTSHKFYLMYSWWFSWSADWNLLLGYFIGAGKWITSFILCGWRGASFELYRIHTKDKRVCCEGESCMENPRSLESRNARGRREPQGQSTGASPWRKLGESFINSAYEFSVSGSALP